MESNELNIGCAFKELVSRGYGVDYLIELFDIPEARYDEFKDMYERVRSDIFSSR